VIIFLTGCFQLTSRILLGLERNIETQLLSLSGYVVSTLSIIVYSWVCEIPSYSVIFALGISPMAMALFQSVYLILRSGEKESASNLEVEKEFTGFNYAFVYLLVSILSTFNLYFPRFMTNLRDVQLTQYLLTFTAIGMFMNISSAVSQVYWVENIKLFPDKKSIKSKYRKAFLGSVSFLPIFVLFSLFLFKVYLKMDFDSSVLSLILVAFISLVFQNMHIISASLILTKKDLLLASLFLFTQNIFLVMISKIQNQHLTGTWYLLVILGSSLVCNFVPSLLLISKRVKQNEA
jgi:hypothetical protein